MVFHSSLNTAMSLQELGRSIHLCTNNTETSGSQTHFMVLFGCVHIAFLKKGRGEEGGEKTPPPLLAHAAPLIAVMALLNMRIHSDTVFNCNSSQFSDIHKF